MCSMMNTDLTRTHQKGTRRISTSSYVRIIGRIARLVSLGKRQWRVIFDPLAESAPASVLWKLLGPWIHLGASGSY